MSFKTCCLLLACLLFGFVFSVSIFSNDVFLAAWNNYVWFETYIQQDYREEGRRYQEQKCNSSSNKDEPLLPKAYTSDRCIRSISRHSQLCNHCNHFRTNRSGSDIRKKLSVWPYLGTFCSLSGWGNLSWKKKYTYIGTYLQTDRELSAYVAQEFHIFNYLILPYLYVIFCATR